jgi:multiple sugar transport system ATP-binding protein
VISVVEPTGAETYVVARVAEREVTAVVRDRRALRPGEPIRLRPDPAMMHLFDKETGRRI